MPPHRQLNGLLPGTEMALADLPEEQPRFTKRMECVAVDNVRKVPSTEKWFREIKWDGYRVCVVRTGKKASVRTKANVEPSARYHHIEAAFARSDLPDLVLDGELVALDAEERPVFQLLQRSRRNRALVVVYIFDVLNYAGRNLKRLPLQHRRAVLDTIAGDFPEYVRLSPLLPQDIPMDRLVRALNENRLEGIVVKRKNSTYLEGKSPGSWIKHRLYAVGEFIIGGYLKRDEPYFGALIVGERVDGRLLYRDKVRFGFDDQKKRDLLRRMSELETPDCPFDNLPGAKRRGSLTAQQMREAVWVMPQLHCTVEYTERTQSGNIRGHGRFGELIITTPNRQDI